ncbi:hypothetical protein B0T20DRAFT_110986 [Sordaria brevicollis]|uniref:Uncharacterized protein n=1 Tax=Sordaria brevicollis TaxID=83679 RepID=A0AAE0U0D3_SORBR|nr:hypothetical protein B0T20DRAFT_110986 [Sordaria brevicollis]
MSPYSSTDDAPFVGKQYSWLNSILYLAQLFWQPAAAFIPVELPTGMVIAAAIFSGVFSCHHVCLYRHQIPSGDALRARFVRSCNSAGLCFRYANMVATEQTDPPDELLDRHDQCGFLSWAASIRMAWVISKTTRCSVTRLTFVLWPPDRLVSSVVVLIFMRDSSMEAKDLGEREKIIPVERLRVNPMGVASRTWR